MARVRNETDLTTALLFSGSVFYHEALDTCCGREQ